ncbi:hypothetical protein ACQVPW_23345, partial [Bacillus cereus]
CLNSSTCNRLLFLLPISPYLHSFCALFALTLQLATGCSFSYLSLLTYIPFALYFPYFSQLATGCSFSYLSLLTYIPFALYFPYFSQLATGLRYPCPISFNLQQYNLFLNQVIFKKSCHFKVFKLFFSYFE